MRNYLRRSLLFTPGDNLPKLRKAAQLEVDSLIMDLEDGVALAHKDAARQTVSKALGMFDFGRSERLIRLSSPEEAPAYDDIRLTAVARPDGYIIPKVERVAQVQAIGRHLAHIEEENEWPQRSIHLLALVETARGLMNVDRLAGSSARLQALLFGAEDYTNDIGGRRSREGWEILYARSALVNAATAFGLQAIDTVFADLHDLTQLDVECRFARQLGFAGKLAIHPRQLSVINAVFTPTPEEIAEAQKIGKAYAENVTAGSGVFELDGQMVDLPVVQRAERLLQQARDAGVLTD